MIAGVGFGRIEWFETGEKEVWSQPEMAARLTWLVRRLKLTPQYHAPYEPPFDLARDGDGLRAPAEIAAVLCRSMDRAQRLCASTITMHLGSCPSGADRAKALDAVLQGVLLAVPELQRRRLRLALENHTQAIIASSLGDRPEDFDWLMERLNSEWVGRTLDIGHAHINGHLDEFLGHRFDRIYNIHLHDNHGEKDEHLPLGAGSIPWKDTLGRISAAGYDGPITFEFFTTPDVYRRCIQLVRDA
jgi:sugar phosphate isomerase/epimerase